MSLLHVTTWERSIFYFLRSAWTQSSHEEPSDQSQVTHSIKQFASKVSFKCHEGQERPKNCYGLKDIRCNDNMSTLGLPSRELQGWQQSLINDKRRYHIYNTDCRWNNSSISMLSFLNLLVMLLHKSKWHPSLSKDSWKKVMECGLFDRTGGELCVWRFSGRCVVRALLSLWLADHSPWSQGC